MSAAPRPAGPRFWISAAVGWAVIGWGVYGIFSNSLDTRPANLAKFVVGGALLHDLLVAPVLILVGVLIARAVPARVRGPVQAALVVSGIVALFSWPLVRAWRFGADDKRLGGVGDLDPYLDRYAELTGLEVSREELLTWEVFGNVKWATGCLTQSRRHLNGQERSVELAVLGRLAAEMEYELLDLIDHAA
mgnify:CR=1 FL=1